MKLELERAVPINNRLQPQQNIIENTHPKFLSQTQKDYTVHPKYALKCKGKENCLHAMPKNEIATTIKRVPRELTNHLHYICKGCNEITVSS